ncbi:MAG: PQQ-binding-like beta-propeller repeat protein [Gammaproteobacteria bacterium]|nr:PQQ-binding-like beta-propeller repeat protein [Gammaproteobacteria bacterium]
MNNDLLWQDRHDGGLAADDSARAIAVSARRTYAVGHLTDPYSSTRFAVRAYETTTGKLLWQDNSTAGNTRDVVVSGGRVFVTGHRTTRQSGGAFVVRVYNAKYGNLLWEDRLSVPSAPDVESDEALDNIANTLATKGHRIFAVGWAGKGLVCAYHVRDGELLWEDGSEGAFTTWHTVVADNKRVFVGGQISPSEGLLGKVILRAHDAETGTILWENKWDKLSYLASSKALTRQGKRIAVVGTVLNSTGEWNFAVRVYHATTGQLLWEDMGDNVADDDNVTNSLRAVALYGNQLFAAGTLKNDFAVRSYDLRSGTLLWENRFSSESIGSANDICVRNGQVFSAGFTDRFLNQKYLVRALNTRDGRSLWEEMVEGAGNEHASAIGAHENRVYVSGALNSLSTGRDFTVRAYRQERTSHPTHGE